MRFSKKKITSFIAGTLSLSLVMSSWAYFTSTASVDNEARTLDYGWNTVERFTPDQVFQPGTKIDKAVGSVTNLGDYRIVVRIKLDESWSREINGVDVPFQTIGNDGPINTVDYIPGDYPNQTAPFPVPYDPVVPTWTAAQTSLIDGDTTDDETVVYKDIGNNVWWRSYDGYYYYMGFLFPGQTTFGDLMSHIRLADNTDMGVYHTVDYYSIRAKDVVEQELYALWQQYWQGGNPSMTKDAYLAAVNDVYQWKNMATDPPADVKTITYQKSETTLDSDHMGYSNAKYTLTITTEVCQATAEAVATEWGLYLTPFGPGQTSPDPDNYDVIDILGAMDLDFPQFPTPSP